MEYNSSVTSPIHGEYQVTFEGPAGADIYDITRFVQPVTVTSTLLPWPLEGYTNGKSVFLTAAQVGAIAEVMGDSTLYATAEMGWEENVPGKGAKVLAKRYIGDVTYYRFKSHWQFTPTS